MVYKISQLFARFIFKTYFRSRVIGQENIPKEGAYILVANHTSFVDPLLICSVFPRIIHYITYAFFYFHPAIHWFCKRVFCIPIKREGNDISALKQSLRLLKNGELVGIFPEGIRSESGRLGKGEPGAALIALRAGVSIVPIGIRGAYEAFPKGSKFPKPRPITLAVGKPFSLEDYLESSDEQAFGDRQLYATDIIMRKIAELCGQQETCIPDLSHVIE